jgi:hypothetical protein
VPEALWTEAIEVARVEFAAAWARVVVLNACYSDVALAWSSALPAEQRLPTARSSCRCLRPRAAA